MLRVAVFPVLAAMAMPVTAQDVLRDPRSVSCAEAAEIARAFVPDDLWAGQTVAEDAAVPQTYAAARAAFAFASGSARHVLGLDTPPSAGALAHLPDAHSDIVVTDGAGDTITGDRLVAFRFFLLDRVLTCLRPAALEDWTTDPQAPLAIDAEGRSMLERLL